MTPLANYSPQFSHFTKDLAPKDSRTPANLDIAARLSVAHARLLPHRETEDAYRWCVSSSGST